MPSTATVNLESLSPLSFSRHYTTDKLSKELPKDYEVRTWRDRLHSDDNGEVFIPPMAPKHCVTEASRFLGMKIPGKRNATYTKHFEAGVIVFDPIMLGVKKQDVRGEWLFVPSDGKRGGGSRVEKCFPLIPRWSGTVIFHILDDTITEDVFKLHLEEAGNFIGIGRFRPRNSGYYGRFSVAKFKWEYTPRPSV